MCAAHFPTATLRRRTQAGSWSSLGGQPGLLRQLRDRETTCLSNWGNNLELSSGFHVCLYMCAYIYVHMYLYNAHRETISMALISQNSDTFEGHSHFTNEKNWDSEANWLDSDLSLDFSRSLIYIAINSSMCSSDPWFSKYPPPKRYLQNWDSCTHLQALNIWEAETRGMQIPGQPELCRAPISE